MDPRSNPYAPGAGVPPPELAGRDDLIERVSIALDRVRAGRAARGFIFHGLRGVGKTVLLNRIRLDAEAQGFASVKIEAPEERSLPALLSSALRTTLLRLNRSQAAKICMASARVSCRSPWWPLAYHSFWLLQGRPSPMRNVFSNSSRLIDWTVTQRAWRS